MKSKTRPMLVILLLLIAIPSGRKIFENHPEVADIETKPIRKTLSNIAAKSITLSSVASPELKAAELLDEDDLCKNQEDSVLSLEINQWRQPDQDALNADIIRLNDPNQFISTITGLFSKGGCRRDIKSPLRRFESEIQKYCQRTVEQGTRAYEFESISQEEIDEFRKENIFEISAAGLCLHFFLKYRLHVANDRVKSVPLDEIKDAPLLVNAFLGEIIDGNRDLEKLERVLERALELEPSLESADWYRLQISYLRLAKTPDDPKLQEHFSELSERYRPRGHEDDMGLRQYLAHIAILNRDWSALDKRISEIGEQDPQARRYFQAWAAYVQGDVRTANETLDVIIRREESHYANAIHESLTAKKKMAASARGVSAREIFSPPLVMFGLAFFAPTGDSGSFTSVGDVHAFLDDSRRLLESKEGRAAFQEILDQNLMRAPSSSEELPLKSE